MSAYIIALIDIDNRDEYHKYEAGFLEIFSLYYTMNTDYISDDSFQNDARESNICRTSSTGRFVEVQPM